jgi:UDP-2,3-diacylglucosamine hydrolase
VRHLFVSDLHLDASAPATVQRFLRFLALEARAAASLYILGDLFETWIGDDDPDPVRSQVCDALRTLTASGVPVYLMCGNRDFLYGEAFERRTGVRLLADPTVATLDGQRILLTHGDLLCTDDVSYQELRSTVRSLAFKDRVSALSVEARQWMASAARAGSRAHVRQTAADIMDVNSKAVIAAFEATSTLTMIHGHTHRPAEHHHSTTNGVARRIVLAAWDEDGEFLVVSDKNWSRQRVN